MKIAFSGMGYINKVHNQATQNCSLELAAVAYYRSESMAQFAPELGIPTSIG